VALSLLSGDVVRADGPEPALLKAGIQCTPTSEAGRVRCEVQAAVAGGTIRWADAEILQVPEMVTPLRGRIGPRDAILKEPHLWRLSLALVGKRAGEGPVQVRVRVVVCDAVDGKERCLPLSAEATGRVKIGA
jgi:hypothetical protein